MALKKITTDITYKVPGWHYCNLQDNPKKERCRFCVKDGTGYRCALYNMPLTVESTVLAVKTRDCERATAGFKSTVVDVEEVKVPTEPTIDPKLVMKVAIDEYVKTRNKLLGQGYPATLADKVAREYVLGGN